MAEEKGNDAAISARIEKLEELVVQNDALRKQTKIWSIVGVLVILALLCTFVLRLSNHFQTTYVTPLQEEPAEFLTDFMEQSGVQRTLRQEGQRAVFQLRDEVLKNFTETLYDELKIAMPELETQAADMGGRLSDHAQEHLQKKVNDALAESLEECFAEIEKQFPDLKEKDLSKYMDKGKEQFVEQLHDAIEDRTALVASHIDGLKGAATKVRNSKGSDMLTKEREGEAAELLIDALVDVIVYELKPELGEEPAE